ncbi:heme-binding protein 2-like [Styela clava]
MASCYLISALAILASFCLIESAVINEMPTVYEEIITGEQDNMFTEDWKNAFDNEQLQNQPKWTPDEDQPKDDSYEVRNYDPAWWVTSFVPCLNQTVASSYGYLKLYLYMNKANDQHMEFNLTYPILNKVDMQFNAQYIDEDKKGRNPCPDRYSVNLYLPYESDDEYYIDDTPPNGQDEIVTTSKSQLKTRYVLPYEDEFTIESLENCNEQAKDFGERLKEDGKNVNVNSYHCAMYEPDKQGVVRFEVWFDDIDQ